MEETQTYLDAVVKGDLAAIKEKLEHAAADAIMNIVEERKAEVIDKLNKS